MAGNYMHSIMERQLSGRLARARPYLCDLRDDGERAGTLQVNPCGTVTPPFACTYSKVYQNGHLLAIADEEGYISVVDTSRELPQSLSLDSISAGAPTPKAQWLAHHNAVFDIVWTKGDACMLTASGDQTVGLWDTGTAQLLGSFSGHTGSVKSVTPHHEWPDVFASGARDGVVLVWDYRVPPSSLRTGGERVFSPVLQIVDAHPHHTDGGKAGGAARGRRRRRDEASVKNSVTSVQFLRSGWGLVTGGASDGMVKFWDVRNLSAAGSSPPAEAPMALGAFPSQSQGMRRHGVVSIAQDPDGARLLVSCTNSCHYLYSAAHPGSTPLATLRGHLSGSFYVKACFSPDGSHVLSGSSDKRAYIWQVDRPHDPPLVLEGHEGEVTGVAWCTSDPCELATCGDDATAKIWRVQRSARDSPREPGAKGRRTTVLLPARPPPCVRMPAEALQAVMQASAAAAAAPWAVTPSPGGRAASQALLPLLLHCTAPQPAALAAAACPAAAAAAASGGPLQPLAQQQPSMSPAAAGAQLLNESDRATAPAAAAAGRGPLYRGRRASAVGAGQDDEPAGPAALPEEAAGPTASREGAKEAACGDGEAAGARSAHRPAAAAVAAAAACAAPACRTPFTPRNAQDGAVPSRAARSVGGLPSQRTILGFLTPPPTTGGAAASTRPKTYTQTSMATFVAAAGAPVGSSGGGGGGTIMASAKRRRLSDGAARSGNGGGGGGGGAVQQRLGGGGAGDEVAGGEQKENVGS